MEGEQIQKSICLMQSHGIADEEQERRNMMHVMDDGWASSFFCVMQKISQIPVLECLR